MFISRFRDIITMSSVCSIYLNYIFDKDQEIFYKVYKIKHPDSIYKPHITYKYMLLDMYYNKVKNYIMLMQYDIRRIYATTNNIAMIKKIRLHPKYKKFSISNKSLDDIRFKIEVNKSILRQSDPRNFLNTNYLS